MYSSKSVQWVIKTAEGKGLERLAVIGKFKLLISDYFEAKTDTERERRAKVIRKFAKDIKKAWEGLEREEIEKKLVDNIPYSDITQAKIRDNKK